MRRLPFLSHVTLLAICLLAAKRAGAHPASGIAVNAAGEVFFIHTGRGIGKIDNKGEQTYIHTVKGGGHFLALDKEGKFATQFPRLFERITPAGQTPSLLYASGGAPLVVASDGNLYYGSGYPDGDDRAPGGLTLTRVSPDGKRTLFAPDLKAKLAELKEAVTGLAASPDGSLLVACPNAIFRVTFDGSVSTLLHPIVVPDCDSAFDDDQPPSPFFHPPYLRGIDVAEDGTVYAAVTGCRCVVRIAPEGQVTNILKSEPSWAPTGVAVHGPAVFVLEYSNIDKPEGWLPRVRKLDQQRNIITLFTATAESAQRAENLHSFAGSKPGDERTVAGIKLCWCPPGEFTFGSPPSEPERRPGENQVPVKLSKGFWMGKYEVTQGDWKRIAGKLPGDFTAELPEGDELPVGNVNFAEAEAFCAKLTAAGRESGELPATWEFRLPTEAQWEYACRAGTTTATSFGNSIGGKQANILGDKPYNGGEPGPALRKAVKVGNYPANPWGLHDMHGNTCEWCRDWFHLRYPGGVDPDLHDAEATATPNRTRDISRSRRGSCWADGGWPSRSAFRQRFEPARRYDHIGFRVVVVEP